jgi:hypothetical protein
LLLQGQLHLQKPTSKNKARRLEIENFENWHSFIILGEYIEGRVLLSDDLLYLNIRFSKPEKDG